MQRYICQYQTRIANLQESVNDIFVILPIPPNNEYQQIENEKISFSPEPTKTGTDGKYKNKYAFWSLALGPRQAVELNENFFISVEPRKTQNIKDFKICDYEKSQALQLYTMNNSFIKSENSEVKAIVKGIVGKKDKVAVIIKKINRYIIKKLKYGKPILGLYSSDDALKNDCVDCGGFSALFVALCAAIGIPARIIAGFWAGYKINTMHAWAEVLLPNRQWLAVDPTIEQMRRQGRTKKFATLGAVGSDRIVLSIGCDIPVDINNKKYSAPILQNPFITASQGENSFQSQTNFITNIVK